MDDAKKFESAVRTANISIVVMAFLLIWFCGGGWYMMEKIVNSATQIKENEK